MTCRSDDWEDYEQDSWEEALERYKQAVFNAGGDPDRPTPPPDKKPELEETTE